MSSSELADAARGELLDEAVAEGDPLEPAQLALAVERITSASATGSSWVQSERSRWIA